MRNIEKFDLSSMTLEELKSLVSSMEEMVELKRFEQNLEWDARQYQRRSPSPTRS